MSLTNIYIINHKKYNLDRKMHFKFYFKDLHKLMWQLIWFVEVNNLLNAFLKYFLWLVIHLCKSHIVKFIISITSFIQIFIYYILEVSLITFITTSSLSVFVVKFILALAFFQKNKKHITK